MIHRIIARGLLLLIRQCGKQYETGVSFTSVTTGGDLGLRLGLDLGVFLSLGLVPSLQLEVLTASPEGGVQSGISRGVAFSGLLLRFRVS